MRAFILTIGDELLIGQTVNTNAAWIGEQLSLLGVEVVGSAVVGDEPARIRRALGRAEAEADLVITTGGLGPTHDDLTVQAVAEHVGVPLEIDAAIMRRIEAYYADKGRAVPEAVRSLAEVPRGFDALANAAGTAPGLWYEGEAHVLVVLPGVPQEMRGLMEAHVLPRLSKRQEDLRPVAHRTLLTTGITESSLQEKIAEVVRQMEEGHVRLAYLPSTSGVRLRLTARGAARAEARRRLDAAEEALRTCIDKYVFGMEKDTLEGVVGHVLAERGLTVAAAESCTGGFLAHRLTAVSGASTYFRGGIVAYDNRVKERLLGVSPEALRTGGAVSEHVARQMARGARERLGADLGVAITGIAGPTGGTPEKPVGTVWIGYADDAGAHAVRFHFTNDRQLNKELSSTAALETIRRRLLGIGGREGPWPARSARPAETFSS